MIVLLQHYYWQNEKWWSFHEQSKSIGYRIYKTSNWIRSYNKVSSNIGPISSIGLISSISRKFESDNILKWAGIMTL